MESLFIFIIGYLVMFIIYIICFYILGLKKNNILDSIQVRFLKTRFGFKNKDFNPKVIGLVICFIDPLIISLTGTIAGLPKWNYVFELLIGFVLLMAFIYSFYEIIGKILERRIKDEYKRNRK